MSKRGLERKGQIFEVATRLFKEKGFHNTSMQDLADALGVQKSSLYYHFDSKEALLFQILELGSQTQAARIGEIYAADLSPVEKLRAALIDHALTVMDYQDLFAVYINEFQSLPPEQTAELKLVRDNYQGFFVRMIEDGIASGVFRPVDAKLASLGVLGTITWAHRWFSPDGKLSSQEIAAKLVDLALGGIVAQPECNVR